MILSRRQGNSHRLALDTSVPVHIFYGTYVTGSKKFGCKVYKVQDKRCDSCLTPLSDYRTEDHSVRADF